jgi:RNA polymerase sigma factor (sigma-70 family)
LNLFHRASSATLEAAFDRYYPAVFRFFRYRGADSDTANDLASSVFERALSRLDQFDSRKAQIQTWLFAIARNISINHWKAEKETFSLDEDLPQNDMPLEELTIRAEDKEHVLRAIQLLDNRCREVIALKFSGELSNREIAQLIGISEGNVGVLLYRSLAKLRKELSPSQMEAGHDH